MRTPWVMHVVMILDAYSCEDNDWPRCDEFGAYHRDHDAPRYAVLDVHHPSDDHSPSSIF